MSKYDRELYKALYEYQKNQYDLERASYARLEDKAAKYLTVLTVVISAYTIIIGKFLSIELKIDPLAYAFVIFLVVFIFIFLCFSWFSIFQTLKLSEVKKLDSSFNMIDFFLDNHIETTYWDIAEKYSEAIDVYRMNNSNKIRYMEQGYREISISACSLVILIFIIFFITLIMQ